MTPGKTSVTMTPGTTSGTLTPDTTSGTIAPGTMSGTKAPDTTIGTTTVASTHVSTAADIGIFGGNHILVTFAQNVYQKLVCCCSKCKICPALGGGGGGGHPLPDPPPARSLCSPAVLLAGYFRKHGQIGNFQRRSLAC